MANSFDYDALRAQTMGAGNDEAVTVNTRALIDKVLARYSGEWTTLRELLQNAADASATKVIVRFQSLPSASVAVPQSLDGSVHLKHVLVHHTLNSLVVENNGAPFKPTDWSRLKKIAEGNPDETKIGAFGVGFYSVFAECEEPFVSSGNEALAFYWKGDSLFTRKLHLGNAQSTNTTFVLPMRNKTSPIPLLLSLCQFLTSSLTFVGLESIELWLDNWRIMELHKVIAPNIQVKIPQDVERKTGEGLMQINSVIKEASQLDARWLKAVEWKPKKLLATSKSAQGSTPKAAASTQSLRLFFSKLAPGSSNAAAEKEAKEELVLQNAISEDLLGESLATIFLHTNKANISTLVNKTFSLELERATKKPPPKSTTVSLLTVSYDEHKASNSTMVDRSQTGRDLFTSVLPTKGRIFIGFATNQTTGLNAHISTPSVIPTVERESIDLNNRYVRVWNKELLRAAGVVARIAWTSDMAELSTRLSRMRLQVGRKDPSKDDITGVLPEALFLHKTFTFAESTPSSEVGNLIEEAFWTCNKKSSIDILSSRGILPSSSVRISVEDLGFVEGIPVLPAALAELGIVKKLIDYGVITEIAISDVKKELEGKALGALQLQRFLEWIGHKARINEIDSATVQSLLAVAVANDEKEDAGKVLVLSEIKTYLNVSRIPAEMPLPPSTMPFKFTKKMAKTDLEALGWEDLQMVPWLRWVIDNAGGRGQLTSDQDLENSPSFARAVLPVISKQWDGLSQSSKSTIIELLTLRTTMPTKLGMRKPTESYFPSVNLFDDLPVVIGIHSVKERVLVALGVRKTIDIGVVFERLMTTSPGSPSQKTSATRKWSHVDLIKYLAHVRNDIPPDDIKRLKTTPICPIELELTKVSEKRYLISDLFEPDETLRRLRLPILHWPGPYNPSSAEGRFLCSLGLRTAPSYLELINIISNSSLAGDLSLHDHAFRYFIENHHTKGYATYDHASISLPYLPLQGRDTLEIPINCFTNERAAILGFKILKKELHCHASKFGVRSDPLIQECIGRLVKDPPQDRRAAREIFGYFAGRLNEIDGQYADLLGSALIVPVFGESPNSEVIKSEKSGRLRHIAPRTCFLGNDDRYAEIFDYVDFGQEANSFLIRCGSKQEPTTTELATLVVHDPARLFTVLELPRYLQLLRNLAESWPSVKKNKELVKAMKTAKFLLAYRDTPSKAVKVDHEDEEDQGVKVAELASANQIIIVDDLITYNQFKANLLAAPLEEALENFYYNLGAPELGSLVEEHYNLGSSTQDQHHALKLQKLVQERTRLYLHDFQADLIKHDAKWLDRNLTVVCVHSMSLRKSLRGYKGSNSESRSAALKANSRGYVLHITANYDLFEVSQVLVPMLLNRFKTQNIMMFEMMLATDLQKLQARGYNVQRILRQKAAEAQIAEATRKAQMAKEAEELKNLEAQWNERNSQRSNDLLGDNSMPGVFPNSPDSKNPDRVPEIDQVVRRPRGFFSDIGKRLGLENGRRLFHNGSSNQGSVNGKATSSQDDKPPPYTEDDRQKTPTHVQPETRTAPHHLQQNLVSAIQSSRAHNSTTVNSQPVVNEVKETKSYCDARPGRDISYVGEMASVRIFLCKSTIEILNLPATTFLARNASALNLFASVLLECAAVFALAKNSLHIFYDDSGSTIAFNQNKALFFNYRYFENLHLPDAQQGSRTAALVYWFVVMAHELAHNLVEDHSANHSYYTEALVIQYFPKVAAKIGPSQPPSGNGLEAPLLWRTDTGQQGARRDLLDLD